MILTIREPQPQPFSYLNQQYTRIWDNGAKDDRKMTRLKVQFEYPESAKSSAASTTGESTDAGGNNSNKDKNRSSSNHAMSSSGGEGDLVIDSSYEACWAELQSLKQKYDQVRDYTVHLTADRDSLVAKLERIQSEMAQDGRKIDDSKTFKEARGAAAGVSLFFVLLAVLVSFLLGYMIT